MVSLVLAAERAAITNLLEHLQVPGAFHRLMDPHKLEGESIVIALGHKDLKNVTHPRGCPPGPRVCRLIWCERHILCLHSCLEEGSEVPFWFWCCHIMVICGVKVARGCDSVLRALASPWGQSCQVLPSPLHSHPVCLPSLLPSQLSEHVPSLALSPGRPSCNWFCCSLFLCPSYFRIPWGVV